MTDRIAAIVVTFNRLERLRECIASLRSQTTPLAEIIIVNNASTDGTGDWLAAQEGLTVINQGNEGGAGGFYTGILKAYANRHAWFWCMDDDSAPRADALAALLACGPYQAGKAGYLASLVLWTDGSVHRMNAPWLRPPTGWKHRLMPFDVYDELTWLRSAVSERVVRVEMATFVSILISRRAVEKVGLPLRKMFIWHDDAEYTARIGRHFPNYLILDSVAVHNTAKNEGPNPTQSRKYLYSVRNMIVTLRQEAGSPILKWSKILAFSGLTLKRALLGQVPVGAIGWLWRGFIFDCRPEFPPALALGDQRGSESPEASAASS